MKLINWFGLSLMMLSTYLFYQQTQETIFLVGPISIGLFALGTQLILKKKEVKQWT